ncbi:hypothetical protein [Saccharibacillus kuerlensis]|uniref:Uncharacterized protein n=1 Tax=Saccharibacillus kuerlensis TaxID=459527 RepID=A0ABQ2KTX1_9BACL|nr:hypothetical protein [Saccharibacillus kuerlensis]GGN92263.1 hypothetical protein GCM10010969_04590 [Saccharibacillus kuerlensis]
MKRNRKMKRLLKEAYGRLFGRKGRQEQSVAAYLSQENERKSIQELWRGINEEWALSFMKARV